VVLYKRRAEGSGKKEVRSRACKKPNESPPNGEASSQRKKRKREGETERGLVIPYARLEN